MNRNLLKKVLAFSLTAILLAQSTALACTGVYVGKDVSADGSVMIARTEDMTSSNSKRFIVHPAKDHENGESYTDAHGLSIEYPAHTYRYTATPGSAKRSIGSAPFGAAGFNELGVAATSTITAYPNSKAINADPFVKNGLYELSANDIILSRATSARHGIEIVAEIVDTYGSGEGNIIMTADENEAWYMEIYTGHQYAAIKLPDDMAAVIPNAYMLGEIDIDSPDVIISKDLVNLAESKGFLKKTNGKINLRQTYAEAEKDSNSIRIWGGRRLLYGNIEKDPYKTEHTLLFKPSQKITVKDVMDVTRTRYEGTKYSLDLPGNKYVRAIGTARQEECHILQIRPDMPKELACIEWLCLANAEFSPYLPYYATAITDTPVMCKLDAPEYDDLSMYWASRSLATISALNRSLYGDKIKSFYDAYELSLIEYVKETDKLMSESVIKTKTANDICYNVTYDAYNKAKALYAELIKFIAAYEGEDEFTNNKLKFEIKLVPTVEKVASHTISDQPIITEE